VRPVDRSCPQGALIRDDAPRFAATRQPHIGLVQPPDAHPGHSQIGKPHGDLAMRLGKMRLIQFQGGVGHRAEGPGQWRRTWQAVLPEGLGRAPERRSATARSRDAQAAWRMLALALEPVAVVLIQRAHEA